MSGIGNNARFSIGTGYSSEDHEHSVSRSRKSESRVEAWDLENFLDSAAVTAPPVPAAPAIKAKEARHRVQYAVCVLSKLPALALLQDALNSLTFSPAAGCKQAITALIESPQFRRLVALSRPLPTPIDLFGIRDSPLFAPVGEVNLPLLFDYLHPARVIAILEALLAERRVVIACDSLAALTPICQSLLFLLYPFHWQYLYVPVLPRRLFQYLQCPTPFLMGIHRQFVSKASQLTGEDTIIVDCDHDQIQYKSSYNQAETGKFPIEFREKFIREAKQMFKLSNVLPVSAPPRASLADCAYRLRSLLADYWCSLLRHYRRSCFYLPDSSDSDPIQVFDRESFLIQRSDDTRTFLAAFLHSSFFTNFLHSRSKRAIQDPITSAHAFMRTVRDGILSNPEDVFDWGESQTEDGKLISSFPSTSADEVSVPVYAWLERHKRFSEIETPVESESMQLLIPFNLDDFGMDKESDTGLGAEQSNGNQLASVDLMKEFLKLT
jgi:hypothetical protein